MYTSGNIQIQISAILADQGREKIVSKVKVTRWYTIVSNEVTDVSNKEQLTIVRAF